MTTSLELGSKWYREIFTVTASLEMGKKGPEFYREIFAVTTSLAIGEYGTVKFSRLLSRWK